MKKILLMLCVLACVTGCNKNTEVEESKVIENQPEVVQENIEKEESKETEKKEEVKIETKQETEKNIDNKYERVTSIPDEHIAYINSIEKSGEDYLVKAQLYGPFVFDKEEVESKFKNNEKIYFKTNMYEEDGWHIALNDDEQSTGVSETVKYVLKNAEGNTWFYLKKNKQGNYRAYTTAQMDPWMLTDKYVEFIMDKNACVISAAIEFEDEDVTTSIKEFYEQNKNSFNLAEQSEHPSGTYSVHFVGGKAIYLMRRTTGI